MFLQVVFFELIAVTLLYNGGSTQWFSYLIAILFQTLAFVNFIY
jgi:hypothetical protein